MASVSWALDAEALRELKSEYERPDEIPYPSDNPYSEQKAQLGKMLFFDPRLSASGSQSCATCHNPSFHWVDGLPQSVGHEHKKLARKSQALLNLAWDELFFWDGRAKSLEEQVIQPIESVEEMGMDMLQLLQTLQSIPGYQSAFAQAFPDQQPAMSKDTMAKALATYVRSIVSGTAPFDRWIAGDDNAISETAKKGFELFNGKANCSACHAEWNFSDGSFHDIGLKTDDPGRARILPNVSSMQHAFKTVGLRNIAERAPYMHNGSLATLADVVAHYNNGFIQRESLSVEIEPLNLSRQEQHALVAFLETLTSQDAPVSLPVLPRK
ncbi:MAG: cytochrome c peroxidase [Oleiphilaceae bacterium]|nr:cytochrome c peroxidase [Oleiphilaceae bacterium]